MKRQTIKLITIGIIGCSITGLGYQFMRNTFINKPHSINEVKGDLRSNFEVKESIVKALNEQCSLKILDVQATARTVIHGASDIIAFKDNTIVDFVGNTSFQIDFNGISDHQVEVNGEAIILTLKEPTLTEVSINEDLTTISKDEGFLSWIFQEKYLTQEENLMLTKEVKKDIMEEANKEMKTAKEKASEKIESLINTLTKTDYHVKINWIK